MSPRPPQLETLFVELRATGITVGVTEVLRLQRVLAMEPRVDMAGLVRLVTAVVAKSVVEVEVIEGVLRRWAGEAEGWGKAQRRDSVSALAAPSLSGRAPIAKPGDSVPALAAPSLSGRAPIAEPGDFGAHGPKTVWFARYQQVVRVVPLALVAVWAELAIVWFFWPQQEVSPLRVPVALSQSYPGETRQGRLPDIDESASLSGMFESEAQHHGLLCLALAAVVGGFLWRRYQRRSQLPAAAPVPQRPGPSRIHLGTSNWKDAPKLLLPEEDEAVVWGIERFVAEEPSSQLDLSASVAETVRCAGRPVLCFEGARYHREIWLWCDESSDDPTLLALASELESTLGASGLVVRLAFFWGIPERLVEVQGHTLAPGELDERRGEVMVAIFTDGRLLGLELEGEKRRRRCEALLRDMSHWPYVAWVDFGNGQLASLLAVHGFLTLDPARLVQFFAGIGGGSRSRRAPQERTSSLWAAACALATQSVDVTTAEALRRKLVNERGVDISSWEIRRMPRSRMRLRFSQVERARLLNWLLGSEALQQGRIAKQSLFDVALDFWEDRYAQEAVRRRASDHEVPWSGTPAEQHLTLQRGLVSLWRQPKTAAETLYALFAGGWRKEVRTALSPLVPADFASRLGAEAVVLPWSFGDLPGRVQVMFEEMGLGGNWRLSLPRALGRPGRMWLALGFCAGLGLGAALGWASQWSEAPRIPHPGEARIHSGDGSTLVFVPSDGYRLGTDLGEERSRPVWSQGENVLKYSHPAHSVRLTCFWISKYPVTNAQYENFLLTRPSRERPAFWDDARFNQPRQPVVGVSWAQAGAYCQWAGMELPTEAQWEAAARGKDGRRYPWGVDEPTPSRALYGKTLTSGFPDPVDSHPAGTGPFGTFHQAGNVFEWCYDAWDPTAYQARDGRLNPVTLPLDEPSEDAPRVLRGGTWHSRAESLASDIRSMDSGSVRLESVGFRCVLSCPSQP